MSTRIKNKKPTLKKLAAEVDMLRSFLIGTAGKDSEGAYRPEFVEEILRDAETATPVRQFVNAKDFLNRIHRTK